MNSGETRQSAVVVDTGIENFTRQQVNPKVGVVELLNGASEPTTDEPPIEFIFGLSSVNRHDFALMSGELGHLEYTSSNRELINILLATRDLGPLTTEQLIQLGWLSDTINNFPNTTQLDELARKISPQVKQAIQWINQNLENPLLAYALNPATNLVDSIGITPNARVINPLQKKSLESRAQEVVKPELEHLRIETVDVAGATLAVVRELTAAQDDKAPQEHSTQEVPVTLDSVILSGELCKEEALGLITRHEHFQFTKQQQVVLSLEFGIFLEQLTGQIIVNDLPYEQIFEARLHSPDAGLHYFLNKSEADAQLILKRSLSQVDQHSPTLAHLLSSQAAIVNN